MTSKLEVKGLCRSFGNFKALDHVSFALPAGAVYGFVGPNGAGKTTCLRILAGIDEADSGTILIDGKDLSCYPEELRRQTGLMPDTLPDLSDMTVWEYLDFISRSFGKNAEQRQKDLDHVCTQTDVKRMLDQKLNTLSKGMKQQVSLARILLSDADILLLDEPAAGLDPKARIELRKTLAAVAADGKTLLVSSHILNELEDMVSGMILLDKGKIFYAGSLEQIATEKEAETCIQVLITLQNDAEKYLEQFKAFRFFSTAVIHSPKQILATLTPGTAFNTAMHALFALDLPISGVFRHDLGLEGIFINATEKGENRK